MGRIAAGTPIAAISEASHNVAVPHAMLGQGEHYALEVKGDSMIEAGKPRSNGSAKPAARLHWNRRMPCCPRKFTAMIR